jgi:predicted N-acyltransferase
LDPTGEFDVLIAHSVQEVGQEAWDRLAGDRPFASYRWYCYGEAVLADNLPIYVILSQDGEAVARATFWLRHNEPLPISSPPVRRLAEPIFRRWPLLICQAPLADVSGLILPEPPYRDPALAAIGRVTQDLLQQHRASFVLFVYLEEPETRWPGWPAAFKATNLPEPGTRLAITWSDFDSYLADLSKKSRRQYRSNCQRAGELGIHVSRHQPGAKWDGHSLDQALALIRNVEDFYSSPPFPWARATHEQAGLVDACWLAAEQEGRLVGCCLLIGDGGWWRWLLLGRDYDTEYAYFQLAYEAVRCAIEGGVRVLWGGTGSYETKRRLGFQATADTYAVFLGRGPLLGGLGRWLAGMEERQVAESHGD